MSSSQTLRTRVALRLAKTIAGRKAWQRLAGAQVDDSKGWNRLGGVGKYDRDIAESQEMYDDALVAWRKNPIAKKAIDITTDYILGDGVQISSPNSDIQNFIDAFMAHPENHAAWNYVAMSDEISRAGDLFVVLFRNKISGMSYIRFVVKPEIVKIQTSKRDWSKELIYYQRKDLSDPRRWYSPNHRASRNRRAIMLHFSINRPIGALLGESDLATVLTWMRKYSRMLEDRIRLHWAARVFLWFVKVPNKQIETKTEQYRRPPEPGSIVVHDDNEEWTLKTPQLHGIDSSFDMEALRRLIYAGLGHPPHWFGERGSNKAESVEMAAPSERHLKRRQRTFKHMLRDILLVAYSRAAEIEKVPPFPAGIPNHKLIDITVSEPSRRDAEELANSAQSIAEAYKELNEQFPAKSERLASLFTALTLQFAGEPQEVATIEEIIGQAFDPSAESDESDEPSED